MSLGKVSLVCALSLLLVVGCGSKLVKDAETFVEVKEYQRAEDLLNLEIQANPKNVGAYLLLGKVKLLQDEEGEATQSFETALLLEKKSKTKIAAIYADAGKRRYLDVTQEWKSDDLPPRLHFATRYLEEAVARDPEGAAGILEWALEETVKTTKARKTTLPIVLLSRVVQSSPDPKARSRASEVAIKTASQYTDLGFHQQAAHWASVAGEWNPKHLKAAAAILRTAGLAEKDERHLEKALQWDSSLANDEEVAWQLVQLGKLTHEQHLERFPNGTHAAAARSHVARMRRAVIIWDDVYWGMSVEEVARVLGGRVRRLDSLDVPLFAEHVPVSNFSFSCQVIFQGESGGLSRLNCRPAGYGWASHRIFEDIFGYFSQTLGAPYSDETVVPDGPVLEEPYRVVKWRRGQTEIHTAYGGGSLPLTFKLASD
jgi:tetratricopeptide (TPR) repeat protein